MTVDGARAAAGVFLPGVRARRRKHLPPSAREERDEKSED
jgi:hypothetical protein